MITPLLQSKIDLLPDRPGSYQMKDKNGKIIYVGKAKSLVKRVKQYFTRPQAGKVMKMVEEIADFDIIETNTEKESLLLEINLIQKYYPKYNILLKDGKMYPYIALKKDNDPFLKIAHHDKEKGYYYFGPFPSSSSAYTMIRLMNKVFPLRKCAHIPNKPCLYYYLGQCLGPCINKISEDDYKDIVSHMTKLMNGDSSELEAEIKKKMKEASDKMDFERAEDFKEQLSSIQHIVSEQKIMFEDHIDRDVVGYSQREGYLSVVIFLYRRGILLGKSLFVVQQMGELADQIEEILFEFYQKHPKPKELIVSLHEIKDVLAQALEIQVIVPERGFKNDLLFMALENAKQGLDQHFLTARLDDDNLVLLENLGKMLQIPTPLDIELYDNSHLQGADAVGAMVKFINGEKAPEMYRKFNLRGENTKDDLASMKEVLTRRFKRLKEENGKFPDLIILDGGETQVQAAVEVENETDVNVPLAGLKKNDKHETEALINGQSGEYIPVDKTSPLFFLLMRMQDEVHRFAISAFRHKHAKDFYQTIYDDIPGIGKKRKNMLLDAYPTIDSLKSASLEELEQLIPLEAAQAIKEKIAQAEKKN
ncbi:MAG: excinuclease ABC subunit UvrC [Bacilli bacterium]|jgi:excinuclease ABC subunit C|nr:excinuclease ABC subunit UvrC [Bacilli bacterium]